MMSFGDGKTSLRGGAGIFLRPPALMGMLSNRFVDEWPFSPQFILLHGQVAAAPTACFQPPVPSATHSARRRLDSGGTQLQRELRLASYPTFPSPFPAPTNFAYIPPFNEIAVSYDPSGNYHVPTTLYEWNLTLERQLPGRYPVPGRLMSVLVRSIFSRPSITIPEVTLTRKDVSRNRKKKGGNATGSVGAAW